ncbi:hypothetical protein ACFX19_002408 [Malus domestica]
MGVPIPEPISSQKPCKNMILNLNFTYKVQSRTERGKPEAYLTGEIQETHRSSCVRRVAETRRRWRKTRLLMMMGVFLKQVRWCACVYVGLGPSVQREIRETALTREEQKAMWEKDRETLGLCACVWENGEGGEGSSEKEKDRERMK